MNRRRPHGGSIRRRRRCLAGVAHAAFDADAVGEAVIGAQLHCVARRAGRHIAGAQKLGGQIGRRRQLVGGTRARLGAAAVERGGRIVEGGVGAAGEHARVEVAVSVTHLDAAGVARTHDRAGGGAGGQRRRIAVGARHFGDEHGFLKNLPGGVEAAHGKFLARILVLDDGAADFERIGDFVLSVDAADPERGAALIEFIGDADRLRIEARIKAGHRRPEQQPPGVGFDLVVGETRLRLGLENQRRLVAVARDDLDFFAVDHRTGRQPEEERSGGAIGGELAHHLAEGVAAGEGIDLIRRAFGMPFGAGERARKLRQRARAGRPGGRVVAVEHEGLALVDTHIKPPGGLAVEAARGGVAVDRIELVRADVAEHALAQILVGVIGQGQQVFPFDLAFQEQRGARLGRALAVARFVMETADLLFEVVAAPGRDQVLQGQAVEVDRAFDDAGADQRPQVGQEGHLLDALHHAAGNIDRGLARIGRRRQLEFSGAAGDEHLGAGFERVEVLHQPAAEVRLQGQRVARGDQRALVIHQTHLDGDRGSAVGGRRIDRVDHDARQRARCDDLQLHLAAQIAETVGLTRDDVVRPGLEREANIFPGLDRFRLQSRFFADARGRHFSAVDQQGESGAQHALQLNIGGSHWQRIAVFQIEDGKHVVHLDNQFFKRLGGQRRLCHIRQLRVGGVALPGRQIRVAGIDAAGRPQGLHRLERARPRRDRHARQARRGNPGDALGSQQRFGGAGADIALGQRANAASGGRRQRLGQAGGEGAIQFGLCGFAFFAPRLDLLHHIGRTRALGEIGAHHLALFDIDKAR